MKRATGVTSVLEFLFTGYI